MSKCVSCEYALYDGMCLAQGKYTVLDADSCELYRPTQGYEVARLKRENAKLRDLVHDLYADYSNEWPDRAGCVYLNRLCELGIEVGDSGDGHVA